MIWIIAGVAVIAWNIWNHIRCIKNHEEYSDLMSVIIPTIILTIIAVFLFGPSSTQHVENKSEYELASMSTQNYSKTGGKVNGGLFYIHGTIGTEGTTEYTVYRKISDVDFHLEHLPSSITTIHYSDDAPKVVTTSYTCSELKMTFWGIEKCVPPEPFYDVYIPKGSITNDFNL